MKKNQPLLLFLVRVRSYGPRMAFTAPRLASYLGASACQGINAFLLVSAILIFSLGVNSTASAQMPHARIDSLKSTLLNLQGVELATRLNDISWAYRNIEIDSSLAYARKAHELASTLDYKQGIVQSLNFIGIAYRNKSNYTKAFELFIRALKAAENANIQDQICYSLINLGNIYLYQTNFEGGLPYFERALKKAEELGNENIKVYCLLNIGRAHSGLGNFELAADFYDQTRNLRKSLNDLEGFSIATVDLGELYVRMGAYDKALTVFKEVLDDLKRFDHKGTLTFAYNNMAQVFLKRNRLDSAAYYVNASLELTRKYGLKNNESQALKILSEIYEKRGNYPKSLEYHKAYVSTKDSIFNEENTRKIEVFFANYEEEKLAAEKDLLQKQAELNELLIKRQESIIIWVIVVSVLLLVIVLLLYWFSSQRKRLIDQISKQNKAAYKHNIDLLDLNNEKNNLIRILSHDLRAPISNIKSLTQLLQLENEETLAPNDHQNLEHIKSESDRLLTMIRKILDLEALDAGTFKSSSDKINMKDLLSRVINAYKDSAMSKHLELIPAVGEEDVYVDGDEVHLTQVIENLLSNAIKFSREHKKVWASLTSNANHVRVMIKDEGPGLTDDDKSKIFKKFQQLSARPTGNEESTGLGLSIVKRYTEEMNGKIWYESEVGKGTSFIVEFKRVA